ncbi:MAG: hypothetical protein ACT4OX_00045 [Actinomycetota bacterium]
MAPPVDESVPARRSLLRACAWGAVPAAIVFTWMLAIGRLDLLHSGSLDTFFDSQARALFDGHWDIPREELGFEAFIVDGKSYTYFGLWPSVLRMPVLAVTDRFDGRLTQVSMLGAFSVLLVATSRLCVRIRQLARGDEPVTRAEQVAAGACVFIVGAGSVVLFLASRPVVYHEAELWGAAWAVAAFAAILGFVRAPNRRDLVWATVATTLALLTRGSVGLSPLVALGCLLAVALAAIVAARTGHQTLAVPARALGVDAGAIRSFAVPLLCACTVPFMLYAAVNMARFDHPWRLPIEDQIATQIDPVRPAIFEGTDGSLFAPKFVPTNVVAMFRPDAIAIDGLFPFVTFPERAHELGDVTFATFDPAASLPVSTPSLFVGACVGTYLVFRRARPGAPAYARLRVLVVGGIAGGLGVLTIPFVNHRYQSDLLPLLLVLAAAGWVEGVRRFERPQSGWRSVVLVAVALLTLVSVWVNFALALQYQRAYSPFPTESERAAYLAFQDDFDDHVPGGSRATVVTGVALPEPAAGGTFFVLGDCDGVYWSDGAAWHAVERTHATGRFPLLMTRRDQAVGTRELLLRAGAAEIQDELWIEYLDGSRVRFVLDAARVADVTASEPVRLPADVPTRIEITFDNRLGRFGVEIDGASVFGLAYLLAPDPVRVAGRDGDPDLQLEPTAAPFCHDLSTS